MDTAFWNIIHDGGIDAVAGRVPGDVVLTIGIQYLCEYLPAPGDTLLATLRNCRLFVYTPYDEEPVTDLRGIGDMDVEVLRATAGPDRVTIDCVSGTLEAAYDSVEVRTVEGRFVSQAELEAAANRSVAAWRKQSLG